MQIDFTITRKRILIIDDDADLLELLKEFFEDTGFEIRTSERATNVFQMIDEFKPDLVILDYLLKGINGGEICHQIKNSITTKHIPVMLFSAYPKVLLSLGLYGCDLFIPKPFDLASFMQNIRQLIYMNSPKLNLKDSFRMRIDNIIPLKKAGLIIMGPSQQSGPYYSIKK